jgi:hypothetical protein
MSKSNKDIWLDMNDSVVSTAIQITSDDIDLSTITITDPNTTSVDSTFIVDDTLWTGTTDYTFSVNTYRNINPDQVEDMCNEYPALEKVWRNFKSVYDMVLQDYKGKQKERGLDDDIPF